MTSLVDDAVMWRALQADISAVPCEWFELRDGLARWTKYLAHKNSGAVTIVTNEQGNCVAVTRTDDEHRVVSTLWERTSAPSAADRSTSAPSNEGVGSATGGAVSAPLAEPTCAICGEHANEHLAIPHLFMPGGRATAKSGELCCDQDILNLLKPHAAKAENDGSLLSRCFGEITVLRGNLSLAEERLANAVLEIERLQQESARQNIIYTPCETHRGMTFTMTVGMAPSYRAVCPLCRDKDGNLPTSPSGGEP